MAPTPCQHKRHCGGQPAQGLWRVDSAADVAEAGAWFDALAQGARRRCRFAATFWSPGFAWSDRFGTPWMVNVPQT